MTASGFTFLMNLSSSVLSSSMYLGLTSKVTKCCCKNTALGTVIAYFAASTASGTVVDVSVSAK